MNTINPRMILLARESRGWPQQLLSEKIRSNKANLSRLENGDAQASEQLLDAIAEATGYPRQFFYQKGEVLPLNLAYRKRQKVPAKIITPIEAQINIMRMHAELMTVLNNQPVPELPLYKVTSAHTPVVIADFVRKAWKIKTPVIPKLLQLLENQGILINAFDFGTERVDSKSIITRNQFPMIFLNAALLGDKQRFSLAYELGHLIMHSFSVIPHNRDVSREANVFAAAFLMPEKEIRKDFENGITVALLGELKRKWKVSMIALLYRADDLGYLTANQKRYLLQQFNRLKIRRREPPELDVPSEQPRLVRSILAECRRKINAGTTEMAALLSLEVSDYLELYS